MAWEQQAGIGISRELIAMQDAINAETFAEVANRPVRERTMALAKQRDAYCRALLEERMPARLHWVIAKPRLLRYLLRLIPRWQPTLTIVKLSADGGRDRWMREWMRKQEARGRETKGIVFTYTDASGLPAEVYGP